MKLYLMKGCIIIHIIYTCIIICSNKPFITNMLMFNHTPFYVMFRWMSFCLHYRNIQDANKINDPNGFLTYVILYSTQTEAMV